MNPGVTSRPAREIMSHPTTTTTMATMPMTTFCQEVQRSARYSVNGVRDRCTGSHTAARTAGSPVITEREIVTPPPSDMDGGR